MVQVKHYYQLERPLGPGVVEELLKGMDARGADLGLIVTAGTIGEDTRALVNQLVDEEGRRITLMGAGACRALLGPLRDGGVALSSSPESTRSRSDLAIFVAASTHRSSSPLSS